MNQVFFWFFFARATAIWTVVCFGWKFEFQKTVMESWMGNLELVGFANFCDFLMKVLSFFWTKLGENLKFE